MGQKEREREREREREKEEERERGGAMRRAGMLICEKLINSVIYSERGDTDAPTCSVKS